MKRRTGTNLADSPYDCTNVGMCSLHSLLFLRALRKPGLAVGMYVQTEWRDPEDARRVRAKNFSRARNCGYVRHPRKQRTSRFQEMVGFMLKL